MKKSVFMFALAIIAMLGLSSCREDGKWDDSLYFEGDPSSRINIHVKKTTTRIPADWSNPERWETTYQHSVANFTKNFILKGGGETKISKIEYKVSFKYHYNGETRNRNYTFTEMIDPSQVVVTYSNTPHAINQYFGSPNEANEGNAWSAKIANELNPYDGEVTITAHTQLGKTLTKTFTASIQKDFVN